MIIWKLDAVMQARGIKGRELARRMNIGENYLSRVRHEVPDRLSLKLLDALCRELDCELSDLLEYQGGPRARRAAAADSAPKREKIPAQRAPRARATKAPKPSPDRPALVVTAPSPDLRPSAESSEAVTLSAEPTPKASELGKAGPGREASSASVSLRMERRVQPAFQADVAPEPSPFLEEVLGPLMAEFNHAAPLAESGPRAGASGVLKNSALQARLERLKKRRPVSL